VTSEESNKKIKKLRSVTKSRLQKIEQHSKLLDEAFEKLREVSENEVDFILSKILEINKCFYDLKNG
jgi:hypothetical protein